MDTITYISETKGKPADTLERLFPGNADSSNLTIECSRVDYSASAIARAVEDCNAHLLNLNVTSQQASTADAVVVDLRISHRNTSAVARSLERYGFIVTATDEDADDPLAAKAREHALELLHYLDN